MKPPLQQSEGVGVEALFIEEEDAGAKGEEHDGDAGGDAEAGSDGGGTIVTSTDDDMAGDDDQEFQDAALEQPKEVGRRLAIRAAGFGPEADFLPRAVSEKPHLDGIPPTRKNEGPLRGQ